MSKANKAVAERWGKEIWNEGNLAAVDEIVAADCVVHTPQGDERGREVIKQARRRWQSAFADMRFTVIELTAEGDKVVEHWSFKGIHKGEWRGIRGTGEPVAFAGVTKMRVAGGMVAETWVHDNSAAFLRQADKAPAGAAASSAVVDRWAEIWNEGRLALVDEIVSGDCVMHSSLRGDQRGQGPVRQSYERYRAAFPDLHFTVIQRVVEGDKVSQNWIFAGTHKGEWNGVAATGKHVTYGGANVFRIADGKVVEIWSYWDMGAFLRQAGKTIS